MEKTIQDCIVQCQQCVAACNECAIACLHEEDVAHLKTCISLDMECAAICNTAAIVMSMNGTMMKKLCAVCADICEQCTAECSKHKHMEHCARCAKVCASCAAACKKMAA